MAHVADFIYQRLANFSGTAQYVFDSVANRARVFPVYSGADQGDVYPMIIYQLLGGQSTQSMAGISGLGFQRVLIKAFVDNNDVDMLDRMTDQIKLALQGFQDLNNGISSVLLEHGPIVDYDEAARVYFSILEFTVGFQELQLS